ncbi:hypothetical protein M0R45_010894 [Rubus argutus]|uniref:Uncharacterized protein n=1 Tax=Rubus argutus TaxID=59490 RepID=A0AAW1YAX7_RUBAR
MPCSSPPLPPVVLSSLSHQLCFDRSCPSQHLSLFRAGSSSLGAAPPLPLYPKPRLIPPVEPKGNEIPTRRSRSRRNTGSVKVGSLGRCSKQYLKEQRGRLYIMWRCTVMLLCWHD